MTLPLTGVTVEVGITDLISVYAGLRVLLEATQVAHASNCREPACVYNEIGIAADRLMLLANLRIQDVVKAAL